ncbi:lipopolysaccharide kinase InaA family protein [Frigoriglobus tundricola]|uniref:Protein kinase domain-containing protein n=1 Tax=Frigoriglobus tundricola TaxID=2774151 RepID=A0A6M5YJ36_9BACT|nr:lipopolysaccharide kinase InaA family protein [Frigoriglobus tundricola]QJW92982.1 hypothetical protein FTUN_0480 [Frigoriglobus tundricola]
MPHNVLIPPASARTGPGLSEPVIVFAPGAPGGTLTVHPDFERLFTNAGLTAASALLDLPGEVVSGHPDRHVARVGVPGAARAFYLKRQHVIGWKERLRNRLAGFSWVSRCEREAVLLQQLAAAGLPAPRWAAHGTHNGRAFLLVEDVAGATDLRRFLSDGTRSHSHRLAVAVRLGKAIAAVHAAGFGTPDLTAKHVLVNPNTLALTFLDWQSAARGAVSEAARADALGALHASLAEALAAPRERVRALKAYREALRLSGSGEPHTSRRGARLSNPAPSPSLSETVTHPRKRASAFAQMILRAAERHSQRRSVRDQLQPVTDEKPQRLVWLAGEAVCVVPEIAAAWPRPAVAPPFYGFGPDGASRVRFAGRETVLLRGVTTAPLDRVRAWLRASPWRSPGVTVGRVLFHLARYGVPAPPLLAFGQRLVSATNAEWFALHETPPGTPLRAGAARPPPRTGGPRSSRPPSAWKNFTPPGVCCLTRGRPSR